jgi:hypothetical protein
MFHLIWMLATCYLQRKRLGGWRGVKIKKYQRHQGNAVASSEGR